MVFHYGDLPDSVITKNFLPLCRNFWKLYREMGWEWFKGEMDKVAEDVGYNLIRTVISDGLRTAEAVMSGKIKNPEQVVGDTIFPPRGPIRSDLMRGAMKALYGESVDCSYLVIHDEKREIQTILNGHMENGIPVDWWMIGPEDELLERRHMKLGYKLKDIPKYSKSITQVGEKVTGVLRDVRNERTPQFSDSTYLVFPSYSIPPWDKLWTMNFYEATAGIWDCLAAKQAYGLPDVPFAYVPWPPIIQSAVFMGRKKFTSMMVGLTMEHKLYLTGFRPEERVLIENNYPIAWNRLIVEKLEKEGVPYPSQTLACEFPDYKKKRTFETEAFDWSYPPGPRITLNDLELGFDEVVTGVLLDVTHDTEPGKCELHKKIISTGCGLNTKSYSKEIEVSS